MRFALFLSATIATCLIFFSCSSRYWYRPKVKVAPSEATLQKPEKLSVQDPTPIMEASERASYILLENKNIAGDSNTTSVVEHPISKKNQNLRIPYKIVQPEHLPHIMKRVIHFWRWLF